MNCIICGKEIKQSYANSRCLGNYCRSCANNAGLTTEQINELKYQQIAELKAKNQQLQQQLKDNTKQVCEKIKKQIFNHFNVKNMEEYENLSLIDGLFTADAAIEMLDTILKEYQK